jgi:hypothetical protein
MPENNARNIKPLYGQVLSFLLWLASAGLGLYAIYSVFKLTTGLYALIGQDYYTGVLAGQVATVAAGQVWIVAVVVGGETLRKYAGKSKIWRLLGWIIGIELLLIVLGIIFG